MLTNGDGEEHEEGADGGLLGEGTEVALALDLVVGSWEAWESAPGKRGGGES